MPFAAETIARCLQIVAATGCPPDERSEYERQDLPLRATLFHADIPPVTVGRVERRPRVMGPLCCHLHHRINA